MIKEAIVKLVNKEDLTFAEAETVLDEIMDGECNDVQIGSFLTALSCNCLLYTSPSPRDTR